MVNKVFSLRQLQEKCREPGGRHIRPGESWWSFYHPVPPNLMPPAPPPQGPEDNHVLPLCDSGLSGIVQYDGSSSDPFPIKSDVKQKCILAPTLFCVFFSLFLCYAFRESDGGIFLHIKSDGNLFNLAHLRDTTKILSSPSHPAWRKLILWLEMSAQPLQSLLAITLWLWSPISAKQHAIIYPWSRRAT